VTKIISVVLTAVLVLIAASAARAQENPPSEESIRELMRITETRKMLEAGRLNMESAAQAPLRQLVANQGLSERQEKMLGEMIAGYLAIVQEEMRPEVLEPIFIDIYRQSFTQKEVDGMIAFYKTDVGRASVEKMPDIMKRMTEIMMQRMQTIFPKLQQMQQEMIRKLKEEK
jgi:uncharacterized protein